MHTYIIHVHVGVQVYVEVRSQCQGFPSVHPAFFETESLTVMLSTETDRLAIESQGFSCHLFQAQRL